MGYIDSVKFTHDGMALTFKTEPNPLNASQMYWFEPLPTMYAGTVSEAKTIANNIRARLKEQGATVTR